jgi:hypothetical protein
MPMASSQRSIHCNMLFACGAVLLFDTLIIIIFCFCFISITKSFVLLIVFVVIITIIIVVIVIFSDYSFLKH